MGETASIPKRPEIHTALPGPKSKAIIEKDEQYISPSYTRGYPFVINRGEGAMVQDADGNWFLDFCAGIAVNAAGHNHPRVTKAIKSQVDRFLHYSGTDFYYDVMADLAEKLDHTSGGPTPKRVFFSNSGAESNEGAMKLARYYTGRPNIISFYRSFHGRTYGAMSLSASKSVQKSHFSPLVPGVHHAHYPYSYRPFFGNSNPEAEAEACLTFIKDYLFKMVVQPDDVAGILVEAIQGEGGYVVPPANWLPGLRKLCDEHGILLMMDEVQAGMGRTGKLWAFEHDGIEPDIFTCAKGIASGLPLGAIIAKRDIMNWKPGTHATTFGGNPVACAAALATFNVLYEDGVMHNAAVQGERLINGLHTLVGRYDCLAEARGRGLMVGLEVITDKASKGKNQALRDKIVDTAYEHGLLILGCGENTIRFCPPLVVDSDQVDCTLEIIDKTLDKLTH